MESWANSIKKAKQHKLQRCKFLAGSHNPDYMARHANECKELASGKDTETNKRINDEQEKRFSAQKPTNSITPIRLNRSPPR